MGDLDNLTRLPEDFDGQVRLFPLPSLVLFPHAMQPLHIFEPRYCEMLAEALESDELIAMATLTSNDDATVGEPPIAQTICVGRIVSHVELEDERHNILLVGIRRGVVTEEIDAGRCFRIARVDVKDDLYPPSGSATRSKLRGDLLQAFGEVIPSTDSVQQGLDELMSSTMGLGPITDIIAHTLPLAVSAKLKLLAEPDVDRRAKRLIENLSGGALQLNAKLPGTEQESTGSGDDGQRPFPPPFSIN
ncbi:ATP-dependent protease [Roseiconus nitratireducens]|uniref:ATP-dependent protease n=1 Tax=Roseiconus nitratireducens TaxID=2605748 RepID=A0A5M6DBC3_9BACT|nr:LON peptidase substrate-binding domain-containing protein [Roseiconus nitratireducens]KAA5543806.1 ATP-dependent protease [Roseiconus nitratireducens]